MERCLMCGKRIGLSGNWQEVLFEEDLLCHACRSQWIERKQKFQIDGIRADSDWEYEGGFSKCLLQYKECNDEALQEVFLNLKREKLRRRYRGYTLLLMPSTEEKNEERGFHHLPGMFECLGLEMLEPFEKVRTDQQKELNRAGRRKMVHGIRLKPVVTLPEKVVLCDDVITTGSTMRGALNCLERKTHKILIYACASTSFDKEKQRLVKKV